MLSNFEGGIDADHGISKHINSTGKQFNYIFYNDLVVKQIAADPLYQISLARNVTYTKKVICCKSDEEASNYLQIVSDVHDYYYCSLLFHGVVNMRLCLGQTPDQSRIITAC